jgi:hypothetical protein
MYQGIMCFLCGTNWFYIYRPEMAFFVVTAVKNLKYYRAFTGWALQRRRNMSPVRYELGFYIPEDGILHSHRRKPQNLYYSMQFLRIHS